MQGRVVVLRAYQAPFEIHEYEVPDPEPGAVLLRMTQAGICGSDLHSWRGDRTQALQPIAAAGQAMGHEGNGVIVKLGKGVSTDWAGQAVREGDHVVHWSITACGCGHSFSSVMRPNCTLPA